MIKIVAIGNLTHEVEFLSPRKPEEPAQAVSEADG
jgi:hypothetical protein